MAAAKIGIMVGNYRIEAEGEQKEVMEALSDIVEIFSFGSKCGLCKSENTRPLVRTVEFEEEDEKTKKKKKKTVKYYEFNCLDCYARCSLGQHQEGGTLFPKRKNANGEWLPDRGWAKFVPNQKANSESSKSSPNQETPF